MNTVIEGSSQICSDDVGDVLHAHARHNLMLDGAIDPQRLNRNLTAEANHHTGQEQGQQNLDQREAGRRCDV
jgi:hypothetical protein